MGITPQESSMQKGRVINLRGRILPVEKLQDYLPGQGPDDGDTEKVALVACHQATTVAFEVDRVQGQQSIVVRKLEGRLAEVPGFVGGTILANGEPSMIIHFPQVIKSYLATVK